MFSLPQNATIVRLDLFICWLSAPFSVFLGFKDAQVDGGTVEVLGVSGPFRKILVVFGGLFGILLAFIGVFLAFLLIFITDCQVTIRM